MFWIESFARKCKFQMHNTHYSELRHLLWWFMASDSNGWRTPTKANYVHYWCTHLWGTQKFSEFMCIILSNEDWMEKLYPQLCTAPTEYGVDKNKFMMGKNCTISSEFFVVAVVEDHFRTFHFEKIEKKKPPCWVGSMFILVRHHKQVHLHDISFSEAKKMGIQREMAKANDSEITKKKKWVSKRTLVDHTWWNSFDVAVDSIELKCTYLSAWTVRYTKTLNPSSCEHFSSVLFAL